MKVAALAGGIGAGKFLRGLVRAVPPRDVTVVVNTGDDIRLHGLRISPDLDSVTYWLAGTMDRDRGWGRAGESFRSAEELRVFGAEGAWFSLGDIDMATHLFRTGLMESGAPLSEATKRVAARFGLATRILPMTDDPVETRVEVVSSGRVIDLHFEEYWVERGARDEVKSIHYEGADRAMPAPGVVEAIERADAVLLCPSNPIASIGPILSIPAIRDAVAARTERLVGISGIVGGAPLAGMADKLLSSAGVEVTAAGVAGHYRDLLGGLAGWVVDEVDRSLASRIEGLGIRVAVTDTVMGSDAVSEAVARTALSLLP